MDIKLLKQEYFELDKPVPYKDFFIYPVRVKDYYEFYKGIDCLTLDKNKDINGISLSHLGYLFFKIEQEPEMQYLLRLLKIIEVCMGFKNRFCCSKCGEEMSAKK